MKNKNVLILFSFVLLLGSYAYFGEYKREISEAEDSKKKNQIVSFQKDQIQKIEISTVGQTLTLTRTPDGWNLSGPIEDQADNEIVESLMDQVMMEQSVDQISITPAVDLQAYGLNPSLGAISFEDNLGKKQLVEVSVKKNFEGLYFLRKDKQDQILTSGDSWFSFLSKPAEGFRNLRLFRSLISKVNEIKISNKYSQFHLKNNEGKWQVVGNEKLPLDQNAVREILTQVSVSKGIQSLEQKPNGEKLISLELIGDDLKYKSDFFIDKKSKDLLVSINPPVMNIRFGPQVMERLRDMRVADLRDKTLPFQFDLAQVETIEFKTKLKSHKIGKSKDTEDFLKKLKSLKVYNYFDRPTSKSDFTYEIILFDTNGKNIFQLKWSDFKNHEAFAQTSVSDEVFQMDDAQIIRLETQSLIQDKSTQQESSSK